MMKSSFDSFFIICKGMIWNRFYGSRIATNGKKIIASNGNKNIKSNKNFRDRLGIQLMQFKSKMINSSTSSNLDSILAYNVKPQEINASISPLTMKKDLNSSSLNCNSPLSPDNNFNSSSLTRILSLKYASKPQINKYNIHQTISLFGRTCSNDTGSPEVQIAIWTTKIDYLQEHYQNNKHDFKAQRRITELKWKRIRMLKYLKRISLERFYTMLDKIGLDHHYLESIDETYQYHSRKDKTITK